MFKKLNFHYNNNCNLITNIFLIIMITTIVGFNKILLSNPKSLVICDIDETLLYWNKKSIDFYQMVKENFSIINDNPNSLTQIEKDALELLKIYKNIFQPTMTDADGFNNLLNKINSLPGTKIIFLTARTNDKVSNNKFTRKHFETNGLVYDDYEIHYTNNIISEGEYIKTYIDLTEYNDIFFIDNYEYNIKTVKDIFPTIKCYKFEVKY
jgi:hypothetical protein